MALPRRARVLNVLLGVAVGAPGVAVGAPGVAVGAPAQYSPPLAAQVSLASCLTSMCIL